MKHLHEAPMDEANTELGGYEIGFLAGLLVGEGYFGGDGRRPAIVLRMHVRHEPIFRWLERTFPGGKLYGPYHHDGRHYYQWMARGRYLADTLIPLLDVALSPTIDPHSWGRYSQMKERYFGRAAGDAAVPRPPEVPAASPSVNPETDPSPPAAEPRPATEIFAQLRALELER